MSYADNDKFDHMIGWAMLDEQLRSQLLKRESRVEVMGRFGLSPGARAYVSELEDMHTLEGFAERLHQYLSEYRRRH